MPRDGKGVAQLAGLLADATRATFCLAMLDGRAWTAGELARLAGVVPSTASAHLTRLVEGGLVTEVRQGRHRYLRLANPQVAQMVEDLAERVPAPPDPVRSLRAATASAALAHARTCYDHLAGRLGVLLVDAMAGRGLLDVSGGLALTPRGLDWLGELGIDVPVLRAARRPLVRDCLDWTERRPHLGGAAGAALCGHFLSSGWIERLASGRAVRVTAAGEQELVRVLDIRADALVPAGRSTGTGGRA
jgi:DNA-binding transcriptional ArsR family regulator